MKETFPRDVGSTDAGIWDDGHVDDGIGTDSFSKDSFPQDLPGSDTHPADPGELDEASLDGACDTDPDDCGGGVDPGEAPGSVVDSACIPDGTDTYNGNLNGNHLLCEQPNEVLDPIAWFCGNSGETTHRVGTRLPNAWGLHDMLGNVSEWCWDGNDRYTGGPMVDPVGLDSSRGRVFRGSQYCSWCR